MRAYYYDNQDGHQTLPHDSGLDVSEAQLARLGVLYWHIPVPDPNDSNATNANIERIDAIARERDYKNRDIINVTKEGLGDQYEAKLKTFFAECVFLLSLALSCYQAQSHTSNRHMHEDEEIRYVEQGSGFFDVRGSTLLSLHRPFALTIVIMYRALRRPLDPHPRQPRRPARPPRRHLPPLHPRRAQQRPRDAPLQGKSSSHPSPFSLLSN